MEAVIKFITGNPYFSPARSRWYSDPRFPSHRTGSSRKCCRLDTLAGVAIVNLG